MKKQSNQTCKKLQTRKILQSLLRLLRLLRPFEAFFTVILCRPVTTCDDPLYRGRHTKIHVFYAGYRGVTTCDDLYVLTLRARARVRIRACRGYIGKQRHGRHGRHCFPKSQYPCGFHCVRPRNLQKITNS